MEAVVGGRLESVTRTPATNPIERFALLGLLLLAVAVHGWLLTHTYVTARDSIRFARTAIQMERSAGTPANPGEIDDSLTGVLQRAEDPPGYPMAVLVTSWFVRSVYHPPGPTPLADQMLFSAQLAAAIAGVLLIFPMYWLGRQLFGQFAGFAAAAMFQVLPVPAHITSDGLSDGLYLFFLACSLAFGTRAIGRPTIGKFLQCGFATGLCFLVRPEGALGGLSCGFVGIGMVLLGRWPWRAAMGWFTALTVGAVLMAAPYMVLIGGISNKPSVREMMSPILNPRQQMMQGAQGAVPVANAPLIAAVFVPNVDGNKFLWVPQAVVKEAGKGFHYSVAVLGFIGLFTARRMIRDDARIWVIVAFQFLSLALVVTLGYKQSYISERHTLPIVMVGSILAGGSLLPFSRWLCGSRESSVVGVAVAILVVVMMSAIPATLKPLHAQRVGHVLAGRYLAEHAKPEDTIVDPYEWALYYSGRSYSNVSPDPEKPPIHWVVIVPESGNAKRDFSPDSRHDRLKLAESIASHPAAEVVYYWPEDGPVENARVKLYRRDERRVQK